MTDTETSKMDFNANCECCLHKIRSSIKAHHPKGWVKHASRIALLLCDSRRYELMYFVTALQCLGNSAASFFIFDTFYPVLELVMDRNIFTP